MVRIEPGGADWASVGIAVLASALCISQAQCTEKRSAEINGFACANVRLKMTVIGYARVSTDGQDQAAGATRIFQEKVSGTVTDRKALAKAIAALQAGDILLVTRLDRLARSTRDLLNVLAGVSDKGAGFRSIADPMLDTTGPHGKLIIAVLGALAEFERS